MLNIRYWSVLATVGISVVCAARGQPVTVQEDFATDPAGDGWAMYGDTSLFHWDSVKQNLAVEWDSSKTNSYFYHPLGAMLGVDDDFRVSFDLQLQSVAGEGFELSVGLLNLANATQPGFLRGTGSDSPNLVEFDYFPDPEGTYGGGSLTTMLIDSVGASFPHWSGGGYAPGDLALGDVYRVEMVYAGNTHRLQTTVTNITSGGSQGSVLESYLPATFVGFHVDHFVVASYSHYQGWGGSILANGTVDNLRVTVTPRLHGAFAAGGVWEARFLSHTNWRYTLECTTNFHDWDAVSETRQGTESDMILQDTNPPPAKAFYRVRAE
jgi:hypothetical protein